jgi:hypothetical protein
VAQPDDPRTHQKQSVTYPDGGIREIIGDSEWPEIHQQIQQQVAEREHHTKVTAVGGVTA